MEKLWPRKSLLERISQEARHITVIAGPAGYGKSSLGQEIAGASDYRVFWLALSRRHRDATCLTEHICSAIGVEVSLRRNMDSETDWQTFIEDAVAQIGNPFLMVIDDFHKISGATTAEELINVLIKSCPIGSSRVVVLTRSTEGLLLGDLSMRGHVTRLATDDLCFGKNEILSLFRVHFEIPLTNIQAQAIWHATGGWAICLVLLRQLLVVKPVELWQSVIDGLAFNSTLSDFLAQEVFEMLDSGTARNLCIISLMASFEPDVLINADIMNAKEINALLETGFFAKSSETQSQKMHPVVRTFFKKRHDELIPPEETAKLHEKFASTLCSRERFSEALPHLESAGLWREMAELLDNYLDDLLRAGQYETAIFWFERLPESTRSPNLYILHAAACESMARYEDALEASRTAAHLAEKAGQDNVLFGARLRELKTLQWTGQHRVARTLLKKTFESDSDMASVQRLEVELATAHDLMIKGEHLLVASSLRQLNRIWSGSADCYGTARLASFRAFFMLLNGRPIQARELLLSIEPFFRRTRKLFHTIVINLLVGTEVETDASSDTLLRYHAQLQTDKACNTSALIDSTCMEIRLALGQLDPCAEELVAASRRVTEWTECQEYLHSSLMVARQYRLRGDFDRAHYYLSELFSGEFEMAQLGLYREFQAALIFLQSDHLKLKANLRQVERIASQKHFRWASTQIWFAQCQLMLRNDDINQVKGLLERTLRFSRRGGLAYWLRTETEADPEPLSLCLREDIESDFVSPILIRAGTPAARQIAGEIHDWPDEAKLRGLHVLGEIADTSTLAAVRRELRENYGEVRTAARNALAKIPSPEGLGEKYMLTPREVDVLRELAKGLTNKQIASSLFISEKTVKTYVNRIFYKLGVTQRVQAALYYKDNFTDG